MLNRLNPFRANPSVEPLPGEQQALTRFPTPPTPRYTRQAHAPQGELGARVPPAPTEAAQPSELRPSERSRTRQGHSGIPVAVLRKALPLRFANMEAATSDAFVFK